MDRLRAHLNRHRPINAPASAARRARLLDLAGAAAADSILDLGCGTGGWLLEAAALAPEGSVCTGVDSDPLAVAEARWRLAATTAGAVDVSWVEAEAGPWLDAGAPPVDLALCIGSTHAFGGFAHALDAIRGVVRPGGHALVGDLYWRQPPAAEYEAFFGDEAGIVDHAENVAAAEATGWLPIHAETASTDEWDAFEWRALGLVETWCDALEGELPDDVAAFRTQRRAWRDGALRWGRSTLGFGYYVLRRPLRG